MTDTSNDAALMQTLAERLEKTRLPAALDLQKKVDQGGLLNDLDLAFLEQVIHDASQIKPLLDKHPEWQELAARMVHLYHSITTRALENERK